MTLDYFDLAEHCLLKAVDIDSTNSEAYYYLGLVSATKGLFEDSVEFFSHTLDINPEHLAALRDSSVIYLAMGKLTKASQRINKALQLDSKDPYLKVVSRRIRSAYLRKKIQDFLRGLRFH